MRRSTLILLFGYLVALAAAAWGMNVARERTLASLDNPEAVHEWQEWRDYTKEQAQNPAGPVRRREAKATEPPMLILLRDHFAAATVTTMLAVTIFYWFFAVVIRGSLRPSRLGQGEPDEHGLPSRRDA